MSVAEIKSNIINEISLLDDILKLEKITKILGIGMPKKDIYVFSEEQQKRIDLALKQAENGECISDEEAEKEIQKWFDEQE
jgi:hypothetical protein